jgi:hypothetical protein
MLNIAASDGRKEPTRIVVTRGSPEGESSRFGPRRSHALTQALGGFSFSLAIVPHVSVDAPLAPGETCSFAATASRTWSQARSSAAFFLTNLKERE